MRRLFCVFLCLLLILATTACSNNGSIKNPVNFYYYTTDDTTASSLIQAEKREYNSGLTTLINTYLSGPASESLQSPFPGNVQVVAITQTNSIMEIVLSDNFASLSGYDLTLACACLTATVQELTDAVLIQIRAETCDLDGNPYITMSTDALVMNDNLK